jgi:ATP-dependent helicase/nuclease subunit B
MVNQKRKWSLMIDNIWKNLRVLFDNNTLLVTPNQRLTFYLKNRFGVYQKELKKTFWESPRILPFTKWLLDLWYQAQSERLLLDEFQESLIWREVVLAEDQAHDQTGLIGDLQKGYRLAKEWNFDFSKTNPFFENENYFSRVTRAFEKTLQERNFVVAPMLLDLLREEEFPALKYPPKIIFFGFNEVSPQLENFLKFLTTKNVICQKFNPESFSSTAKRISFADLNQELKTVALWAKKEKEKNPKISLGIVIPNLVELRSRVERIFNEIFTQSFNITAGEKLNFFPVIESALDIISLNQNNNDLSFLAKIFNSPFLKGFKEEEGKRALFLAKLRSFSEKHLDFKKIEQVCDLPLLKEILAQFILLNEKFLLEHKLNEWNDLFCQKLEIFGWPGGGQNGNSEIIDKFYQLQAKFAALDLTFANKKFSFAEAFSIFAQLIASVEYQTKANKNSNINILGILETLGMQFDRLWVVGMSNQVWPKNPSPNPFLPIAWQRENHLPHAFAARELEFSKNITQVLQGSAQEVFFSFSKNEENPELEISSLLESIPEMKQSELDLPETNKQSEEFSFHYFSDEVGPSISEKQKISGGSKVFEFQNNCPFRAFAELRLKAKPMEKSTFGLSPRERGNLIHEILEKIWRKIKSHQNLLLHNAGELEQVIKKVVTEVLAKIPQKKLREIEYVCLMNLINQILQQEKKRAKFTVVGLEESWEKTFHNFTIKVRVDRINQMEDQSLQIIDYKTGKSFDLGASQIQLFLYYFICAELNQNVQISDLIFAILSQGKANFRSILAPILKKMDLETIKKEWQEKISRLALDFNLGKASVDPIDQNIACSYCHLEPLCRVKEND